MQWEHLTSDQFAAAVKGQKLCILPMGVLERHGSHLPLGTDGFIAQHVATEAAKAEGGIVMPVFWIGQSNESRAFPGNISLEPLLTLKIIEQLLDEISRNGFEKILLFSWHGGNIHMTHFLAQTRLWKSHPYDLYVYEMDDVVMAQVEQILGEEANHAGKWETSLIMALFPEDVYSEEIPPERVNPLNRMKSLVNAYNGYWWYADYPDNYTGDASSSTAEIGRKLLDVHIRSLRDCIRSILKDESTAALEMEFQKSASNP